MERISYKVNRINLTDGSGKWFDYDKVDTYYAFGDSTPDRYEYLHRTPGGTFILQIQMRGLYTTPKYEEVTNDFAREWLIRNNHDPDNLGENTYNLEIL